MPRLLLLPACLFVITAALNAQAQDTLRHSVVREVVVTGQYVPTDVRKAVVPVKVLNRERIERSGANNLEQLLRLELNLRVRQDMVLGSNLSIQGLSGQNVKILIDGVPVVGRLNGNIDLGQINLANIERVEIIEGPASVFYGTDALAGVVNLITRRGQAGQWNLGATGQYEQLGERSAILHGGVQLGQKVLLMGSAGLDRFEGYDTSATTRNPLWNPKTQYYADGMLRLNLYDDHFLRLKWAGFDETVENPGEIRRPQYKPYAFDESYRTRRQDFALLHEGSLGDHYYWNNTLGVNFFKRDKVSLRTDLETGLQTPVDGEQDTARFQSYTLRSVIASKNAARRLEWLAGVDLRADALYGHRILDSTSARAGEAGLYDLAGIGSLRYRPWPNTCLETGLRAAWNSRYDGVLTPSVNIRQDFGRGMDARFVYARGFRSPDLKELYFNFIDFSHYVVGNPELRPEQSDNFQISWTYRAPQVDARALQLREVQFNGFQNRITGKIELYEFRETDQGIEPVLDGNSTGRYTYFNIEEYRTHGLNLRSEASWRAFRLNAGINLTGFYNPYHEKFTKTPAFTYTKELNAALQWQYRSWNAGLWVRTNDRFVRYYPEIVQDETIVAINTIDGFTELDASFGKKLFRERLCIQAGVRNLLNVQTIGVAGVSGGSHSSDGSSAVSPGRSAWVRVAVRLGN